MKNYKNKNDDGDKYGYGYSETNDTNGDKYSYKTTHDFLIHNNTTGLDISFLYDHYNGTGNGYANSMGIGSIDGTGTG